MLESVNLLAENHDVPNQVDESGEKSVINKPTTNDDIEKTENDEERPSNQADDSDDGHITNKPDVEKAENDEEHQECEDVQKEEEADTDEKTTNAPQKNATSHYERKEPPKQNTTNALSSSESNEKHSVNYNSFSELFFRGN